MEQKNKNSEPKLPSEVVTRSIVVALGLGYFSLPAIDYLALKQHLLVSPLPPELQLLLVLSNLASLLSVRYSFLPAWRESERLLGIHSSRK